MGRMLFNANEECENEYFTYTPINKLLFEWSINCKENMIKQEYYREQNRKNIRGLVVYKNGEWGWIEN